MACKWLYNDWDTTRQQSCISKVLNNYAEKTAEEAAKEAHWTSSHTNTLFSSTETCCVCLNALCCILSKTKMQPQTEYNPNHTYTLACAHIQQKFPHTQTAQVDWTQNKSLWTLCNTRSQKMIHKGLFRHETVLSSWHYHLHNFHLLISNTLLHYMFIWG